MSTTNRGATDCGNRPHRTDRGVCAQGGHQPERAVPQLCLARRPADCGQGVVGTVDAHYDGTPVDRVRHGPSSAHGVDPGVGAGEEHGLVAVLPPDPVVLDLVVGVPEDVDHGVVAPAGVLVVAPDHDVITELCVHGSS